MPPWHFSPRSHRTIASNQPFGSWPITGRLSFRDSNRDGRLSGFTLDNIFYHEFARAEIDLGNDAVAYVEVMFV
jgi:hypothetical protein